MSDQQSSDFDVVVIGGGIAGVSIGYELAVDQSVCLLEQESTLAYHTTGRSAAVYLETFGNMEVRALTTCSRAFLTNPPECFEAELLTPIPYLVFARPGRGGSLREFFEEVRGLAPAVRMLSQQEVLDMFPFLKPEAVEAALVDPGAMEVDVHALHQGYVRGMRERGAQIRTRQRVTEIVRVGDRWRIGTEDGETVSASVVVNAAGAWADEVAGRAGAGVLGIEPLIRTIFGVGSPTGTLPKGTPMVHDLDDTFYLKPEGDQFLCSPADETPSFPHDVSTDDLKIARALDDINEATDLRARHVRSSWAGLRSFARDRIPVVGFDSQRDGFFWFAGQGGYGIQMCDALARVGAAAIRGDDLPADVAATGLQFSDLAADRPALDAAPEAGADLIRS
ncbi:NAD(P)/FAD-dependent oxidoreductase [Nocardia sp. NPDC004123]